MTPKDVIAANLRMLRELRTRLGQLELAQRVGVSRRTIARLENAEVADPGIEQVQSLAAALGVTPHMLTTMELEPITIPVPEDVKRRLASEDGAELVEQVIRFVQSQARN